MLPNANTNHLTIFIHLFPLILQYVGLALHLSNPRLSFLSYSLLFYLRVFESSIRYLNEYGSIWNIKWLILMSFLFQIHISYIFNNEDFSYKQMIKMTMTL